MYPFFNDMNLLIKILFSFGLIKLTTKRVENWIAKRKVSELKYALTNGSFAVRKRAIEGLGELKSFSSLPLIIEKLNDSVKIVAFASIKAIEKLGLTIELKEKIETTKKIWLEKELKEKKASENFFIHKGLSEYNWERRSKETLENVRQMLKKPMIGGKWF